MRNEYSGILGTTVFDGEQSRRGYHLEEAAPVLPIVVAVCVTAVALLFDMKRPCSAAHA
jgi:hypothetical protein